MSEPEKLELYQLEIQLVYKSSDKLIPLNSVKSPDKRKIEDLQKEIEESFLAETIAGRRFGFQGEDSTIIFIDFDSVGLCTTQLKSDTFRAVK